ncbi:MAG: DinB family protein [Chloroflexia bacterium]
MSNNLAELFKHNLWANLQLIDACEKLTDEQLDIKVTGTYGSIRETLLHYLGAEKRYADRLFGRPRSPRIEDGGFQGFDYLRRVARTNGQELIDITENNSVPEVYRGLGPDGQTEEMTGGMLIIQAINHSTEHRAHINSIFSILGLEPTGLDGWAYGYTHDMIKIG